MTPQAKRWTTGVIGAIISGGASGLTGFAVGVTTRQLVALTLIPALVSLGKYLKMHPLPGVDSDKEESQ